MSPSKCRDELKRRVKDNEAAKKAAREGGGECHIQGTRGGERPSPIHRFSFGGYRVGFVSASVVDAGAMWKDGVLIVARSSNSLASRCWVLADEATPPPPPPADGRHWLE